MIVPRMNVHNVESRTKATLSQNSGEVSANKRLATLFGSSLEHTGLVVDVDDDDDERNANAKTISKHFNHDLP